MRLIGEKNTAWLLQMKIRKAMIQDDDLMLKGIVEAMKHLSAERLIVSSLGRKTNLKSPEVMNI